MGLKLRDDLESLKAKIARMGGSGLQSTTFVGVTAVVDTYPSVAGRFYAVNPSPLSGDETEGSPWTITTDPSRIMFAYNLGSTVPPLGSIVLVFSVANRWVFFYG